MARTSAKVMARMVGLDIALFRAALKEKNFAWHAPETPWAVDVDSPEHAQMIAVLREVFAREFGAPAAKRKKAAAKSPAKKAAAGAPKKAAKKKSA